MTYVLKICFIGKVEINHPIWVEVVGNVYCGQQELSSICDIHGRDQFGNIYVW